MRKLRIVFMGTAEFAVPCLEKLVQSPHEVCAVVTTPDLPRGRGQRISFTPVKEYATEKGLPVLQPENLREAAFLETLQRFKADLFLVVAYRILPPEVFEMPPLGSVNLHASLLPKYRGAAPINWAIIRGEIETGVTTFFIQKKVDTGNIILQKVTPIGENETAGELNDRLSKIGAETLRETVDRIAEGRVVLSSQDETAATTAPKIFRETCRIDWAKPAAEIGNFVRGLSPYPCATTEIGSETMKIYAVGVGKERSNAVPGAMIADAPGKLGIVAGDGHIVWIEALQPPSRKKMTIAEYLRGRMALTGFGQGRA